MRGKFVFVSRLNEFAIFFFDLAQKIVQFRGLRLLQQGADKFASVRKPAGDNVSKRQVVAIVVGGGINPLRLFQVSSSYADLSSTDVKFAKIVIRVIVLGLQLQRFLELGFGQLQFSQPHKVDRKIHARARQIRLQPNGLLQVRGSFIVLRLRGVDQAKQF